MAKTKGELCPECDDLIFMVDGIARDDPQGPEHECEEEGTECEQCSNFVEDGESLCESCQEEDEDEDD